MNIKNNWKLPLALLVAFSVFLVSCECVPDINTPKNIIPSSHSKVRFFHSLYDKGAIKIDTKNGISLNSLFFSNYNNEYLKLESGLNFIRLKSNESTLPFFSIPLRLAEKEYFSIILSGTEEKTKVICLNDSIENYNPSKSYIRFIHSSSSGNSLIFRVQGFLETSAIKQFDATQFFRIEPGLFNFVAIDNTTQETVSLSSNIQLSPGIIYNLVLMNSFTQNAISDNLKIMSFGYEGN